MNRLVHNTFEEKHNVTIGVEFGSFLITVEDKTFRLQMWDTVGQESFRSITKVFYRGAHAVVLVYSMTDLESFDHLKNWMEEIKA
jgi:small GTP-binding protein